VLGRAGQPVALGGLPVDVGLVVAGLALGGAHGLQARACAPGGHELGDLLVAGGEVGEHRGRDAGDLARAVSERPPADAEGSGELGAQDGLGDGAGGLGRLVDGAHVRGRVAPVRAAHGVGHDHVGVQVRVAGAGELVRVAGAHEPLCGDDAPPAGAATGLELVALQVLQAGLDAGLLRGQD
jgi:hypothetical protein